MIIITQTGIEKFLVIDVNEIQQEPERGAGIM